MKSAHSISYFIIILLILFLGSRYPNKDKTVKTSKEFTFLKPGIAYQPSGYEVGLEFRDKLASNISNDLQKLHSLGFRSLVTYSSLGELGLIPQKARETGFDGTIIAGVWDPTNRDELLSALKQKSFVQGYCIGNEGLGIRYSRSELRTAMAWLREKSGRPVTTSEQIEQYLHGEDTEFLIIQSDFIFPLAHPYWANQTTTSDAIAWLFVQTDLLTATSGQRVLLKEVGFPSNCPSGCSEEKQLELFQKLQDSNLQYFIFEAFDQPWKVMPSEIDEVEAHWGIMTNNRQEKRISTWLNQH